MLHYITLRYITLHYNLPSHNITLQCNVLHSIPVHYTTFHSIPSHCTALHDVALHYTTLHYITLLTFHTATLKYTTLHYIRYIWCGTQMHKINYTKYTTSSYITILHYTHIRLVNPKMPRLGRQPPFLQAAHGHWNHDHGRWHGSEGKGCTIAVGV